MIIRLQKEKEKRGEIEYVVSYEEEEEAKRCEEVLVVMDETVEEIGKNLYRAA